MKKILIKLAGLLNVKLLPDAPAFLHSSLPSYVKITPELSELFTQASIAAAAKITFE